MDITKMFVHDIYCRHEDDLVYRQEDDLVMVQTRGRFGHGHGHIWTLYVLLITLLFVLTTMWWYTALHCKDCNIVILIVSA